MLVWITVKSWGIIWLLHIAAMLKKIQFLCGKLHEVGELVYYRHRFRQLIKWVSSSGQEDQKSLYVNLSTNIGGDDVQGETNRFASLYKQPHVVKKQTFRSGAWSGERIFRGHGVRDSKKTNKCKYIVIV
jgi:hypothetical protein